MYGYKPTITLVALVLATPVAWRRRGIALAVGLVLVQGFILFRVGLKLMEQLADPALGHFVPSSFWRSVLDQLMATFVNAPASYYIVPTFVWIIVCLRPKDLARILPSPPAGAPAS